MKFKKTFITMGSIGGIVATVSFVVSCGENFPKNNHAKGSIYHDIPKKYSYRFWLDCNPLFEDIPGELVKEPLAKVVIFQSNNLYSQQDIFNSMYMISQVNLDNNINAKSYFYLVDDYAQEMDGEFLKSDIKELNENFSFKDDDPIHGENWNKHDRFVLKISHLSFTKSNPTSSTEVKQM